jgi:phospho-2-dehydro-3-deoxyheptonate aldolase
VFRLRLIACGYGASFNYPRWVWVSLLANNKRFAAELCVVMCVYFERARTTVGWKGLINDPYLDKS